MGALSSAEEHLPGPLLHEAPLPEGKPVHDPTWLRELAVVVEQDLHHHRIDSKPVSDFVHRHRVERGALRVRQHLSSSTRQDGLRLNKSLWCLLNVTSDAAQG